MILTTEEETMLAGGQGKAVQKAMQILVALGKIYSASRMVPVSSVQIAGVSYDNLGEAGLEWLSEMAENGGKTRVLATLNPAGMDRENWQALGISADFAEKQQRVLDAFTSMGVITTCTCTPYLIGNLPRFGESIAWAESSAVCFANSVIGARTNREGGPSALAAALTGRTADYGLHRQEHRQPGITVDVTARLEDTADFAALGKAMSEKIATANSNWLKAIPYIRGVDSAGVEQLKAFCASAATYAGLAMFHMQGITPESHIPPPLNTVTLSHDDLEAAKASLNDALSSEVDFVSLGCPHLSIREIARVADLLKGKKVTKEFWITTARPTKQMADTMGYTAVIEASGAKFAVDTCCVVAPIRGRFRAMATDSAKACYYASAKNKFKTLFLSFDDVVREAMA
jgi:predicted aconitase